MPPSLDKLNKDLLKKYFELVNFSRTDEEIHELLEKASRLGEDRLINALEKKFFKPVSDAVTLMHLDQDDEKLYDTLNGGGSFKFDTVKPYRIYRAIFLLVNYRLNILSEKVQLVLPFLNEIDDKKNDNDKIRALEKLFLYSSNKKLLDKINETEQKNTYKNLFLMNMSTLSEIKLNKTSVINLNITGESFINYIFGNKKEVASGHPLFGNSTYQAIFPEDSYIEVAESVGKPVGVSADESADKLVDEAGYLIPKTTNSSSNHYEKINENEYDNVGSVKDWEKFQKGGSFFLRSFTLNSINLYNKYTKEKKKITQSSDKYVFFYEKKINIKSYYELDKPFIYKKDANMQVVDWKNININEAEAQYVGLNEMPGQGSQPLYDPVALQSAGNSEPLYTPADIERDDNTSGSLVEPEYTSSPRDGNSEDDYDNFSLDFDLVP